MDADLIIAMLDQELDLAWKLECERRAWYGGETNPKALAQKKREWEAAKEITWVLERIRARAVEIANLER